MFPALNFLAFIGPRTTLVILQQTFCGFIFAEVPARRPLLTMFSPCILSYRMVGCTPAFVKSAGAQKLVVLSLDTTFRPKLICTFLV